MTRSPRSTRTTKTGFEKTIAEIRRLSRVLSTMTLNVIIQA